jgi:hypothetical protein
MYYIKRDQSFVTTSHSVTHPNTKLSYYSITNHNR